MVLPLRFGRAPAGLRPRIESAEGGRLIVDGNIDGGEALVIEALVHGDVTAGRISVGAAAVVHGNLQGRSVEVAGTVHGAIVASEVQLDAGAVVHGSIEHLSLSIAATADFQGQSIRRPVGQDAQIAEAAAPHGTSAPEALAGPAAAVGEAHALAG